MTTFDVIAKMVNDNNQAVKLAPLNNITSTQLMKDGIKVTIVVPDPQFMSKIEKGELIGGLIYIDKEALEAEKKLMGELK